MRLRTFRSRKQAHDTRIIKPSRAALLKSPITTFQSLRLPGDIAPDSAEVVVAGREVVERADVPVMTAVTNVVPVDVRVTPFDIVIGDPFM